MTALRSMDRASFTYEFPEAAEYYLIVRAASSSGLGTYSVTVTDLRVDDHGDEPVSATALTSDPDPRVSSLETCCYNDCFALAAVAAPLYQLTPAETNVTLYAHRYATDGTHSCSL